MTETKDNKNTQNRGSTAQRSGNFERNRRGGKPRFRKGEKREDRKPEYDQKLLNIRRVARVASGGRRFSFSVSVVIGNGKGQVGVGTGKAGDTALAIEKAVRNAKKNMVNVKMTENSSIPYEVRSKYSSARIMMTPAPGRGIIAGSAVRDVLMLAGLKDVGGKVFSGSKNKLNIARASIEALKNFPAGKPEASVKTSEAVSV